MDPIVITSSPARDWTAIDLTTPVERLEIAEGGTDTYEAPEGCEGVWVDVDATVHVDVAPGVATPSDWPLRPGVHALRVPGGATVRFRAADGDAVVYVRPA